MSRGEQHEPLITGITLEIQPVAPTGWGRSSQPPIKQPKNAVGQDIKKILYLKTKTLLFILMKVDVETGQHVPDANPVYYN